MIAKSLQSVHASVLDGTKSAVDTESHLEAQADVESGIEEYYSEIGESPSELAALANLAAANSKTSESDSESDSESASEFIPSESKSDSTKASTKSTKAAFSIIELLDSEDEPAAKKRKIMTNLKKIKTLLKEIKELEGGSESE